MDLECAHIVLNASNVEKSKKFYIDQLGFELIEEHPQSFAFRAGSVRFSISPNGQNLKETDPCNTSLIFKTRDIQKTRLALLEKGITFSGDIFEAPDFMKFISFIDPDGNSLMLSEYLRDPLAKV